MSSSLSRVVIWISCSVYRIVLGAYPAKFRERYRAEMLQGFRDQLRQTLCSEGFSGFLSFAGRMAWDIPASIARERFNLQLFMAMICAVAATGLGFYAAYVDRHNRNEAYPTLFVVGAGSFAMGLIRPIGVWRWAILIAAGVPFAGSIAMLPHRLATPGSWAMLGVCCVPGLIGAYCAFAMCRVVRLAQ